MEYNPWLVESIQAFYYLKCPECSFDTQEETNFQDHAIENHPLSFALFGKSETDNFEQILNTSLSEDDPNLIENSYNIKQEYDEITDNDTNYDHQNLEHQNYEHQNYEHQNYEHFVIPMKKEIDINLKNESSKDSVPILPLKKQKVKIKKVKKEKKESKPRGRPVKKSYNCIVCENVFDSKSDLKLHFSSVHDGIKSFKCPKCDATYKSRQGLSDHKILVHEQRKPIQCEKCDQGIHGCGTKIQNFFY